MQPPAVQGVPGLIMPKIQENSKVVTTQSLHDRTVCYDAIMLLQKADTFKAPANETAAKAARRGCDITCVTMQELIIPDMSSDEMLEYKSSSDQDASDEPGNAAAPAQENVMMDWKGDPMSKHMANQLLCISCALANCHQRSAPCGLQHELQEVVSS